VFLVPPAGGREHRLCLAHAHLAAPHCLGEERPRPQLPHEPRHVQRRAPGDPEPLAGVVVEPGVSELQEAVALHQRSERLADGDVERATPAHHAGEEAVEEHSRLFAEEAPALMRHGRLERERLRRERLRDREGAEGVYRLLDDVARVAHTLLVARGSDIVLRSRVPGPCRSCERGDRDCD
jgi:hypothetical protein